MSPLDQRDDAIFSRYVKDKNVFEWGGSEVSLYYSHFANSWKVVCYDMDEVRLLTSSGIELNLVLPNSPYVKYEQAQPGQFHDYVNFIHSDKQKYDVIFIRGRDRINCAFAAKSHLTEDGVIIIFDFWNRKRYQTLLDDFEVVDGFGTDSSSVFHTMVVLRPKKDAKKLLLYSGFSSKPWNSDSLQTNAVGGSELATIRVAREFKKLGYDIVVAGSVTAGVCEDGVRYIHLGEDLQRYLDRNKLDVLIISRYLHFVTHYKYHADQVYLLLHDIVYLPWSIDRTKPSSWNEQAKYGDVIHKNLIESDSIENILCLTKWHADYYSSVYPYAKDKIIQWGNAIDPDSFPSYDIPKIKDSFIWTSRAVRGLRTLLGIWPKIKERIPGATLSVYSYSLDGEADVLEKCTELEGVTHHGGVSQSVLLQKIKESEYWLYTTNFSETYCITALEMQFSRVLCVATNLAALQNTVDDRGILFNIPDEGYDSEEYKNLALDSFFKVYEDEDRKQDLLNKAEKWAREQTWENRAKELSNHFVEVAKRRFESWS
jgi:hypothetical protein